MIPKEIDGLAKAACCWLAYKDITGFQSVLSEAMLSIPISEYLSVQTHWRLRPELQYRELCQSKDIPDFWCDFAGTPTYGNDFRFILEAKLLKSPAKNVVNRIVADLLRLSFPLNKGLKRYFLLAGLSQYFPNANEITLFGQNLFGLARGQGRYIRPSDELEKSHFLKAFPLFQYFLIPNNQYASEYAYVQCCAMEEIAVSADRRFRVVVWSVGRSNRIPAGATSPT